MAVFTERVPFKLFCMPCCGALICWVNSRYPSFCPECGKHVLHKLRTDYSCTHMQDDEAYLQTHAKTNVK